MSTVFLCDDTVQRTLGEMIAGYGDGFVPKSDEDVLMVLEHYGADWTSPAVTRSIMKCDDALVALNDPNRHKDANDAFGGCEGVHWVYDRLVNETINEFALRWLPDAHDWKNSYYNVTSLDGKEGMVYRVEMDSPTSGEDCWISFEIAVPNLNDEPMVLFFQALRSGIRDAEVTTYECTDIDSSWVKVDI